MSTNVTVSGQQLGVEQVTAPESIQSLQGANLCQYWPETKSGLQILANTLTGPMAPIYKGVIAILIGIGDAACPAK